MKCPTIRCSQRSPLRGQRWLTSDVSPTAAQERHSLRHDHEYASEMLRGCPRHGGSA